MASLVKRHLVAQAVDRLSYAPVLMIEGARQVGKSTLAGALAPENAPVFNLDDPPILDAAMADPAGLVASGQGGMLVLDEVQRWPPITLSVKAAVDRDRRPGRFILTGSASLLRIRGTQDSMAGRVARLRLFGFSQGEIRGQWDDFAAAVTHLDSSVLGFRSEVARDDYAELCATGAYPEAQSLTTRQRSGWFDDYVDAITRRDLGELRRQVEPERALHVLRLLAASQSLELVKASFASRTQLASSTVTAYLDLFADVQLYQPIRPWSPNLAKREINKPKVLVIDSGLAMRLAGATAEQFRSLIQQEAFGQFLEGFVASELLRQRGWSAEEFSLYHYRDSAGAEVDLVLELADGRVIGIEVKASTSFGGAQFKGLVKLRDALGDRFVAGIVLNTGSSGYRYADRLWGLPVSALWELRSPAWPSSGQ